MIGCMQAAAVNTNTPIVVVLIHGGPLDVSWMENSDRIGAIMSAWYPGQVSLYPLSLIIYLYPYLYQACSNLHTQLMGSSAQSDCSSSDWIQSAALHGWYIPAVLCSVPVGHHHVMSKHALHKNAAIAT